MRFEREEAPFTEGKLNLPSAISAELGRLTALELKSETDDQLNPFYQQFLEGIFRHTATGLLFGQVIFKPYIRGDVIRFCAVPPGGYKILKWDEQRKIPVVTEFYEHREGYVRVERHSLDGQVYSVENGFLKNRRPVNAPWFWAGYAPKVTMSGVHKPLFGLFSTADGKPVYHAALPLIQEAERQFQRLLWEYESGERALYVADTAFLKDFKGRPKVPDKRLYRLLSTSEDNLFQDWTPKLRDTELINGLDCILKRIEDCCSLSRGTFSEVGTTMRTATELKMAKHRTYAAVKELQTALQATLQSMLDGAAALLCLYGERRTATAEAVFDFGDSILNVA